MKSILLLAGLTFFSSHAFATVMYKDVNCTSDNKKILDMTLTADTLQTWSDDRSIARFVGMTVTAPEYDGAIVIGRAKYLESDPKYKGRKYTNHYRFDTTKLTETSDFGSYQPDGCYLNVIVPKTIFKNKKEKMIVVFSCEQGGGTITLSCSMKVDATRL